MGRFVTVARFFHRLYRLNCFFEYKTIFIVEHEDNDHKKVNIQNHITSKSGKAWKTVVLTSRQTRTPVLETPARNRVNVSNASPVAVIFSNHVRSYGRTRSSFTTRSLGLLSNIFIVQTALLVLVLVLLHLHIPLGGTVIPNSRPTVLATNKRAWPTYRAAFAKRRVSSKTYENRARDSVGDRLLARHNETIRRRLHLVYLKNRISSKIMVLKRSCAFYLFVVHSYFAKQLFFNKIKFKKVE